MTDDLMAQLLDLEHAFWNGSTDEDLYRERVADDAVFLFPYGVGAMDKGMVVYAIGAIVEEWVSHELSSVQVVPLGDDAAVIAYKAVAERPDGDPFKAWVSSTYVKQDGRWMLAFHQQTLASTGR